MLPPISSVNLNTTLGVLPIGGHLHQTNGLLQSNQPFQMHHVATTLTPPHINHIQSVEGPQAFRDVLMNTVSGINATTQKPNELLREAMTGGPVDIQDVMIANTKAELAVSATTQVMTKVIQAYEKLTQIQV